MEFEIKKLSFEEVRNLLIASENDYNPPLSQWIDIEKCAQKWSEKAWFLIGKYANEIASVLVFYKNDVVGVLYITHFSVSAKYRHRRIGHAMLSRLIEQYKDEYKSIELEAKKDSVAHAFYIREGFEYIEERGTKVNLSKQINNYNL